MSLAEKLVVDPELEIVCASCGQDMAVMDQSPYLNWPRIHIEVCSECGDYDRGFEEGGVEGREEGEAEGYAAGHSEGVMDGEANVLEAKRDTWYDEGYEKGWAACEADRKKRAREKALARRNAEKEKG